jgi:uncharacterized protein YacL
MIIRLIVVGIITAVITIVSYLATSEMTSLIISLSILLPLGLALVFSEKVMAEFSGKKAVFAIIGATLGILAGFLIGFIFKGISAQLPAAISGNWSIIWPLLTFGIIAILTTFGFSIGWTRAEEIDMVGGLPAPNEGANQQKNPNYYKILDTSVVIDGRIKDIAETGFIDGLFVVPRFVLKELQDVADASDPLKRSRGRRGLDILRDMKNSKKTAIKISDIDFTEVQEVDTKLLMLAKRIGGLVVTNDYNLNKVAALQNVTVLNVNDLSNAVKPIVLPNEELTIHVIKEGKDPRQGVGYLDDGTMIVVDNGMSKIGKEVRVVVTSILQTPAGRMIFTQMVEEMEKNRGSSRSGNGRNERTPDSSGSERRGRNFTRRRGSSGNNDGRTGYSTHYAGHG